MKGLLNGTIEFTRRLTPEERKDLLCGVSDLDQEYVTLEYINLCIPYNILDEVTEWLTSHENGVKEGCRINCYGYCDGAYRYEGGQWRWHSANSICGFGDSELLDELKYRGYDVSGMKDKSEVKHGKWIENQSSDHKWKCSCCNYGYTDYLLSYCYDCGAKMDLE